MVDLSKIKDSVIEGEADEVRDMVKPPVTAALGSVAESTQVPSPSPRTARQPHPATTAALTGAAVSIRLRRRASARPTPNILENFFFIDLYFFPPYLGYPYVSIRLL